MTNSPMAKANRLAADTNHRNDNPMFGGGGFHGIATRQGLLGRLKNAPQRFSMVDLLSIPRLCGRAGRLTALFGAFRAGQCRSARKSAATCRRQTATAAAAWPSSGANPRAALLLVLHEMVARSGGARAGGLTRRPAQERWRQRAGGHRDQELLWRTADDGQG
jgi:hypothetical protein